MSKDNLPKITTTNGFKKCVALGDTAYLGASSGTWDANDFATLRGLWAILTQTGVAEAQTDGGMIRTIDKKGVIEFLATVTMDYARLLLQPRQADGTPVADLINFPIWIEPTDMSAEVPDGIPNRLAYDEEDPDAEPTVKTWSEWLPNRGSYSWKTIGERTLIGSFNRAGYLAKTDTLWKYLELEEAGHFTLLARTEYDALVAENATPDPE